MKHSLFEDEPVPARKFESRNTTTPGQRLEAQVGSALIGLQFKRQHVIGKSYGGRRNHRVDFVVDMPDGVVLVSVKWQGTRGTGGEKVTHEFIRLAEAIELKRAKRAYIVLGGSGWTLREYFESPDFHKVMRGPCSEHVKVVGLEQFIELRNREAL